MLTVYSKPRCMQCEMTKMWLRQNKIEYENVDIEANTGAFELLKHYGFTSLPVVGLMTNLRTRTRLGWDFKSID